MNHWMWPVSLVGILTAVVCGADMFFLTIGRPLSDWLHHLPEPKSLVFSHMFADARMQSGAPRGSCPTSCWSC
jgi:hypothetical protein